MESRFLLLIFSVALCVLRGDSFLAEKGGLRSARTSYSSTERLAYGIAFGYRNASLTVKAKLSSWHCRHPGLVPGSIPFRKKKEYIAALPAFLLLLFQVVASFELKVLGWTALAVINAILSMLWPLCSLKVF